MRTALQISQADLKTWEAEHRARLEAAIGRLAKSGWTATFQWGDRATLFRVAERPEWLILQLDGRGRLTERHWRGPVPGRWLPRLFIGPSVRNCVEQAGMLVGVILVMLGLFLSALILAYVITRAFATPALPQVEQGFARISQRARV